MAAPPAPAPSPAAPGSPPPAQVVGNAFVQQYYNILHQSPDHVFRFYQDASRLGRPAGPGVEMDTVTTMEAINEKIMSMAVAKAEIKAVDAQESLCGGVTVLVTGHLTGKDDVRREFAQSFFLAPQEKGYFVLNDVLRYVGEEEEAEPSPPPPQPQPQPQQPAPEVDAVVAPAPILPNGTVIGPTESVPREQEASPQLEQEVVESASHPQEEDLNEEEVYNPPNDAEVPAVEETAVAEVIVDVHVVEEKPVAALVPQEAPKKSYASIVKVMKEIPPPTSTVPSRPAPAKPEKHAPPAPAPAPAAVPVADTPALSSNPESSNIQGPEVDAHAIYVRNLPLNATNEQLEEQFKRFGTIKHDGIQVRSHKIQGFCYGFVEFEDSSAVQSAIAGSPVMISDRQCYVEEKRTTGSRGSSRGGRFGQGRGGNFRSEGMRGRGNYTGGRSFGRNEFNHRSDYGGRGGGRGGSSRGSDFGYQWVDNNSGTAGGGRGARVPPGNNIAAK